MVRGGFISESFNGAESGKASLADFLFRRSFSEFLNSVQALGSSLESLSRGHPNQ
jgi:hypothetical protein